MRLSLDALRHIAVPRVHSERAPTPARDEGITRRTMLGITGAAPFVVPAVIEAAAHTLDFEIHGDERRLAFVVRGEERWVIDCAAFSGHPRLRMSRSLKRIRLRLRDARYPGTDLRADFEVEIRRILHTHQARFLFAPLRYRTEVAFVPWLLGQATAEGTMEGGTFARFEGGGGVDIVAPARATLHPNWHFEIRGNRIVRVRADDHRFTSDRATFALLPTSAPTLGEQTLAQRSLIIVERGDHGWITPFESLARRGTWMLRDAGSPFDVAWIECGEEERERSHLLLLFSHDERANFTFSPDTRVRGANGKPAEMPLHLARLALEPGHAGMRAVLLAALPESVTLHGERFALDLCQPGDECPFPFELQARCGAVESLKCTPDLRGVSVALPEAIVQTGRVTSAASLPLTWESAANQVRSDLSRLHFGSDTVECKLASYRTSVLRPRDLLVLDFEFINLDVVVSGRGAMLQPRDANEESIVIVHFPPQHVAEQAFFRTLDANRDHGHEPTTLPPVGSRLSGPSRLAFTLPSEEAYPYTLEWLLDWREWKPRLVPVAQVADEEFPKGAIPEIRKPRATETAVEVPYRLFLSPLADGVWKARSSGEGPIAELWRAELTKENDDIPMVRAIWSPDFTPRGTPLPGRFSTSEKCSQGDKKNPNADADALPFRTSLDRRDRSEIVKLSSDFHFRRVGGGPWIPRAIPTRALLLSALGGWLDVHGKWEPIKIALGNGQQPVECDKALPDEQLTVEGWKHRAATGRDNFVQVVYSGFLFPFGHPAVLIKETERQLGRTETNPGSAQYAYLRQRKYILVKKPRKVYTTRVDDSFQIPFEGRAIAFHSITVESTVTPDLDDPATDTIDNLCDDGFWPRVAGELFQFKLAGENRSVNGIDGTLVRFEMPLVFVGLGVAFSGELQKVKEAYRTAPPERVTSALHGQKVTLTDETKPGDTTVEVERITFGSDGPAQNVDCNLFRLHEQPQFYPRIARAGVRVPSMAHFTGSNQAAEVQWTRNYLDVGFGEVNGQGNPGEVFVERVGDALSLDFPGKRSGGFATPSIDVNGLSRSAGPISGDIKQFAAGVFEAAEFFNRVADAKLLGVVKLGDLIQPLKELQNNLNRVPRLLLEQVGLPIADIEKAIENVKRTVFEVVANAQRAAQDTLDAALAPLRQVVDSPAITTARQNLRNAIAAAQTAAIQGEQAADALLKAEAELRAAPILGAVKANIVAAARGALHVEMIDVDEGLRTLPEFARAMESIERQLAASAPPGTVERLRKSIAVRPEAIIEPTLQQIQRVEEAWREITTLPLEAQALGVVAAVVRIDSVANAVTGFAVVSSRIAEYASELQRTVGTAASIPSLIIARIEEAKTQLTDTKNSFEKQLRAEVRNAIAEAESVVSANLKDKAAVFKGDLEKAADKVIQAALANVAARVDDAVKLAADALTKVAPILDAANQYATRIAEVQQLWEQGNAEVQKLLRPRDVVVNYSIEPKLQNAPKEKPVFQTKPKTRFEIRSSLRKRLSLTGDAAELNSPPTFQVDARLEEFKIVLFPGLEFLTLDIGALTFSSTNGSSPDIKVRDVKVEFGQALEFIKALQESLPFGRKGPGFFIDTAPNGVRLGYRFALPSVTVGAFNLQAITLSAAIELPFDAEPALVRFAFCDFDRPFVLTAGIYGGGGFFAVTTSLDRVKRLEGALEFGAATQLDLGVAHGHASVMAGIYFRTESQVRLAADGTRIETDVSLLMGYVRAGGELDVLGLVSMCVEFFMGLTRQGSHVEGEARVKVSIDMRLYTIDVELTCRREFAGGGGATASMDRDNVIQIASGVPIVPARENVQIFDELVPLNEQWDKYERAFAW
jgi:hypothetical protein